MKIAVLNGSPKGDVGVTRQYVLFLERAFPQHRFVVLHVAQKVKVLERDAAAFNQVIQEVRSADGVIWAFPLYILLVCSQYKRFIELIEERGVRSAFLGKHAVTLSTSINYFDHNAHIYMRSVSEDLGMRFVGIHSARMDDIMKKEEQRRLRLFAEDFFTAIERGLEFPRLSAELPARSAMPRASSSTPAPPAGVRPATPVRSVDARGRKIVVLTDERPGQESLQAMTSRLASAWGSAARTVNLRDADIRGGCQGCLRCAPANECAYADGFVEFYKSVLLPADIIVFAGTITARQLSWKWREFFDRSFFNNHVPSLEGKQLAFVVSGPLTLLPELRETYEGWAELQRSNLAAFVSDEAAGVGTAGPAVLEATLDQLAERLVRFAEAGYARPRTFLGVAGMKIFRDDVWSELKVVFRADHRAFKKRGYYDFPQKKAGKRLVMRLAWLVTGLPGIRSKFPSMVRTQMSVPMRRAALKGAE